MVRRLARTAFRTGSRLIPNRVYEMFLQRNMIGLVYHLVSDERVPHVAHLFDFKTMNAFESDLCCLKERYQLIDYEEFLYRRDYPNKRFKRAVLLTFDDGYVECYKNIRPLLIRHEIPAIFFVTTALINNNAMMARHKISLCIETVAQAPSSQLGPWLGQINQRFNQRLTTKAEFAHWAKRYVTISQHEADLMCELLGVDWLTYVRTRKPYMTESQLRELHTAGFTIGAHSITHQQLGMVGEDELREEVLGSCSRIADLTRASEVPFAFPYHSAGVDESRMRKLGAESPNLGAVFDSRGHNRREGEYMFSRISGDTPGKNQKSNMPTLLAQGYGHLALDIFRGALRR